MTEPAVTESAHGNPWRVVAVVLALVVAFGIGVGGTLLLHSAKTKTVVHTKTQEVASTPTECFNAISSGSDTIDGLTTEVTLLQKDGNDGRGIDPKSLAADLDTLKAADAQLLTTRPAWEQSAQACLDKSKQ